VHPVVVPPETLNGKFTYIYPPTYHERITDTLRSAKNFAAVSLYIDQHRNSPPFNAQTEFRTLYGWGEPQGELHKYIRYETSCGKPKKLKVGKLYIALFTKREGPLLIESDLVENIIDSKGKPDYSYTSIGLLPR